MHSIFLLFNGVALGLGAAAPIGPVNVEIARRTLRFGRRAGFALGCGAVTIDVIYAIVTSVTVLPLRSHPHVMTSLTIAAAIFLSYLAFLCLRSAWIGKEMTEEAAPSSAQRSHAGHYATGLLMTTFNPGTLGFWFVAVPGAVASLTAGQGMDLPLVCAGVFLGAFSWVCFFVWLVGHLQRFGRQRWIRWIDLAGGLTLLAFALRAIWQLAAPTL